MPWKKVDFKLGFFYFWCTKYQIECQFRKWTPLHLVESIDPSPRIEQILAWSPLFLRQKANPNVENLIKTLKNYVQKIKSECCESSYILRKWESHSTLTKSPSWCESYLVKFNDFFPTLCIGFNKSFLGCRKRSHVENPLKEKKRRKTKVDHPVMANKCYLGKIEWHSGRLKVVAWMIFILLFVGNTGP